MKLDGIKLDHKQKALVELMQEVIGNLHKKSGWLENISNKFKGNVQSKNNLYVYGGVGRGKTMIAKIFYDAIDVPKQYIHYQNFMRNIHDMMHSYKGYSTSNIIHKLAKEYASKYRYVVIDEFEVHDIADAMIIGNLFKELMKYGVHFLLTTNIHPDELYKNGLQRESFMPFIHLVNKEFNIFSLDGMHDYRLDKIAEDRRVFYPNNKDVMEKIDRIELELIGDHQTKEETLRLFGRNLHLKRVYKDILFTDFEELCMNPISINDFVEIAKHFTVIIMENVPKIGKDETDYAIRFINFIDNIYFHKVLLFISLADEPEKIYPAGRRIEEFKRTISRLHEINSQDYFKNSKHQ